MRRGLMARDENELPQSVLASRVEGLRAAMARERLDGFVCYTNLVQPGAVTYLTGGTQAPQAEAMYAAAANYPLQLDFLWGRGAKESEISKVDWSIQNPAGQTLVNAQSTGPIVLASLPDGHYTVKAMHDGTELTRNITVQNGKQDTVLLEWPQ